MKFFLMLYNAPIPKICVENPRGLPGKTLRRPDQIIQPYFFGDEFQKTTCLWLKNLPQLIHSEEDDLFYKKTHVEKGKFKEWINKKTGLKKRQPAWYYDAFMSCKNKRDGNIRRNLRSKTFPGIANAMAEQWG